MAGIGTSPLQSGGAPSGWARFIAWLTAFAEAVEMDATAYAEARIASLEARIAQLENSAAHAAVAEG